MIRVNEALRWECLVCQEYRIHVRRFGQNDIFSIEICSLTTGFELSLVQPLFFGTVLCILKVGLHFVASDCILPR